MGNPPRELIDLAHTLGQPSEQLAILAEGNVSGFADDQTFWVKASGTSLDTLSPSGLVSVRFAPLLDALGSGGHAPDQLSDDAVRQVLTDAKADPAGLMPSVETFMHAYLLCLPGVNVVGHTHPTALLSLLCLQEAEAYARDRYFPDEIVCCGPESVFVPYVDPGLPLAQAMRLPIEAYVASWGASPKTIWLGNHGLIALGETAAEVESATRMTAKAATVRLQALGSQRTLKRLTSSEIERIHTRPDEHYRQRLLAQLKTSQ